MSHELSITTDGCAVRIHSKSGRGIEKEMLERVEEGIRLSPVVGFREWGVKYIKGEFYLASYNNGLVWPYHKEFQAVCLDHFYSQQPHNSIPFYRGVCGIYALKERTSLHVGMPCCTERMIFIGGSVDLWGKIIEHKNGYRAQYAYPNTLFRVNDSGGVIAYNDNCVFVTYDTSFRPDYTFVQGMTMDSLFDYLIEKYGISNEEKIYV